MWGSEYLSGLILKVPTIHKFSRETCSIWFYNFLCKTSFNKEIYLGKRKNNLIINNSIMLILRISGNFFCGQKYLHNSLAGLNSLIPIQLAGAGDLQCFSYLITIQSEKRWNWNPEVINTKKIFCVIHSSEWHHSSEFLVFHHF